MFTGIIQAVGSIAGIERQGSDCRLKINTGSLDKSDVLVGDSIAVNGVCLTAASLTPTGFFADLSGETLTCTTFGRCRINQAVNLEKCLTPTTRLGGHLVTGHVDGIGEITQRVAVGNSVVMSIRIPQELSRFVALKGSITLDGISLTVSNIQDDTCSVALVPHTLAQTTLQNAKLGLKVNIEVDLVARYLARLLEDLPAQEKASVITSEFLANHGFNL